MLHRSTRSTRTRGRAALDNSHDDDHHHQYEEENESTLSTAATKNSTLLFRDEQLDSLTRQQLYQHTLRLFQWKEDGNKEEEEEQKMTLVDEQQVSEELWKCVKSATIYSCCV